MTFQLWGTNLTLSVVVTVNFNSVPNKTCMFGKLALISHVKLYMMQEKQSLT